MGAFSPSSRTDPTRRFLSVGRPPPGVFDALSGPMRMLVTRLAVLAAGVLLGVALYLLGVGGVLVVPLAAIAAIVIGEGYFLIAGDDGSI